MDRWTADQIPDQSGRIVVVTGANSGLGYHTTRELARHGAHVIMAVRDEAKGKQALQALRSELPDAELELGSLDLSDLDSVREFAGNVRENRGRLDLLVNNAGIMMCPRSETKQGFERQFGTNHLGHFALTGLLLDLLKTGQDARVVTVSSGLHRMGRINFDDLDGRQRYSPTGAYAQSKLANILFALELDRRLRAAAAPLRSVLAHPGYAATNLQTSGPTGLLNRAMRVTTVLLAQPGERGALNQLYAAVHPDVQSGQFIGPNGLGEGRGWPTVVRPNAAGRDPRTAARLWALSEERTGVHYDLPAPA